MTIMIDEDFIALWHFQLGEDVNFIGGLSRGEPSPQPLDMNQKQSLKFVYRFRYYKDDLVFHSEDEKHWYDIRATDYTPLEMMEIVREIVKKAAGSLDVKITELIMDERGPRGMIDRMMKLPFMHAMEGKENEA